MTTAAVAKAAAGWAPATVEAAKRVAAARAVAETAAVVVRVDWAAPATGDSVAGNRANRFQACTVPIRFPLRHLRRSRCLFV